MPEREGSIAIAFILALQAVIYTYDGWTAVIYFSEEVKDSGRNIPRAMFGGVLAVMAIYLLVNVAFLRVVPLGSIAGQKMAAGVVAQHLFGAYGDTILRVIMIVSLISAVNSNVLMAPRVLFAMSRDRLFWRGAAEVNKGGTPDIALLFSSFLAARLRRSPASSSRSSPSWRSSSWRTTRCRSRRSSPCAAARPMRRGRSAPSAIRSRPSLALLASIAFLDRRRHQRHAQLAVRRRRSRSDDPVVPSREARKTA